MKTRGLILTIAVAGLDPAGAAPPARDQQSQNVPRQVAVWYRGTPLGQPLLEDLAALRALGFTAVVWPFDSAAARADISRMADVAGISVFTPAVPAGPAASALAHIPVAGLTATRVAALAWRRVQEGARVLAFDGGAPVGSGIEDGTGQLQTWVAPARAVARQLSVNATLFEELQAGPPVMVDTDADDLKVVLFHTPRSWVLFATSLDSQTRRVEVSLPPGVPAALWTNLLDGSSMSMLNRPIGPFWRTEILHDGVEIYVIDRTSGPRP
jgi:hypothetical protein